MHALQRESGPAQCAAPRMVVRATARLVAQAAWQAQVARDARLERPQGLRGPGFSCDKRAGPAPICSPGVLPHPASSLDLLHYDLEPAALS